MEGSLRRASALNPRDLIRIARQLASEAMGGNRGRPRQAELRRAVSAAYYALFHALALVCSNRLAGSVRANRSEMAWRQTYRALEHVHARNQCNEQSAMRQFPQEVRNFGRTFVYMQGQRQQADYAPDATFSRDRVVQLIDETEDAVNAFENAPGADRRAFAIHVLLRRRRD